jgi:hypothetical protein
MKIFESTKKIDLSFLDPESTEAVQGSVGKVPSTVDLTDSPLPLAPKQELQLDLVSPAKTSTVEVDALPRTEKDWQAFLSKLKDERVRAFKDFDEQRGLDLAYRLRTATIESINAAKADIPVLRKRIASVKRRLAPWMWCPLRKVPILECHLEFKPDGIRRFKRLWTKRQWDAYFMLVLSLLLEKLSGAEYLSKLERCNRQSNGRYNFSNEYVAAEKKFQAADQAHRSALKEFERFHRNGPQVESPDVEIARRLAKYQLADSVLERIGTRTGSISASSGGMYYQTPRPPVHISRPKC